MGRSRDLSYTGAGRQEPMRAALMGNTSEEELRPRRRSEAQDDVLQGSPEGTPEARPARGLRSRGVEQRTPRVCPEQTTLLSNGIQQTPSIFFRRSFKNNKYHQSRVLAAETIDVEINSHS